MVSTETAEWMIAMPAPTMHLRQMNAADLETAVALSSLAGWNQTVQDWSMLMKLAPEGCFGIECDGRLVSTTTLLCYGQRLAWIGMVLTNPEYRGRGFARRLLTHALDYADSLAIETIKLDATDQGRPLYQSFGFQEEQAVERWSRPGVSESHAFRNSSQFKDYLRDLDLEAFGADRSIMLGELAKRSEVQVESKAYLFTRAGRTTAYLGPCVARDPFVAGVLITKAVNALPRVSLFWDLLPSNRDAVGLAAELGFTRQRVLTRMARGKPLRGRDDMIYAIAGFELG